MATAADSSAGKPLQNAMKMAKVAIQLEGEGEHKEAYCSYLRAISYISHTLLKEAESSKGKDVVGVDMERMLRLAEQCLERTKSLIGKSSTSKPPELPTSTSNSDVSGPLEPLHPTVSSPATCANNAAVALIDAKRKESSPAKSGHRRVLSDGAAEISPFLPPEVFQRLQTVTSQQDTSKKELTPIEEASRLNQKLKASYEARMARLRPGQAYQKTSLTLSLQRQMMENLIIAKARQDALQRKMEERRLRLQEEANRRFAASGAMTAEEQEQRLLYTNVLEYEQDNDWPKQWKAKMKTNPDESLALDLVTYLFSRSDHPVVKLLRKHQYRIYNRLYPLIHKRPPQSLAMPLRASRSVHSLLNSENCVNPVRIVGNSVAGQSCKDAPGSSLPSLNPNTNYTDDSEGEELHTQATVDLENSFEDLEEFLDQLDWVPPLGGTEDPAPDFDPTCDSPAQLDLEQDEGYIQELEMRAVKEHLKVIVKDIHIATDQLLSLCLLSFECLNTATSKDLCLATIEEAFFPPLWSALVALFRRVHREREQAFEKSMRLYCNASPRDVGVPLKLFPQNPADFQGAYPYETAVQELKLLVQDNCPQRKLECIVRTLRLICACAENYRCLQEVDPAPKTAAIGADDLLPILSFVALRCQCPQLVSECAALEEFIHEGYLIGEEGYCLTSLQSALAYVESLHARGGQRHLPVVEPS